MNWFGILMRAESRPTDRILDLACGILQWTDGSMPACAEYVGVDAFPSYLENLPPKVRGVEGTLPEACEQFADDSFDVVLLIDVLEHLPKADGLATLDEAIRIASRRVYVYTPVGFMPQEAVDAWGLGLNPLQEHISAWSEDELVSRGLRIAQRIRVTRGPTMLGVWEA